MQQAPKFTKDFTQQEPICEEAIERAVEILRSGKLHRYNVAPGEDGEAALLEAEFARYMGRKYCLATTSCGTSMYIALKSLGVKPGDTVLCNAYTLAPVPGAIENAGAKVELVEITGDYTIDLEDLDRKAGASGATWFLISHMRGHMVDMDRLMQVCEKHNLTLIEDCAHTMGARWDGKLSGSFGAGACFSTQTYKHMNSGEGGLFVTDDDEAMARAIILSGSYMLYGRHGARPELEVFDRVKYHTPNYSTRMDNLRAALLRPQLRVLDEQCRRWNERYQALEAGLKQIPGIRVPERDPKEYYVGSSIQFNLPEADEKAIRAFLAAALERGVELKWFGSVEPVGFTSAYHSWRYFGQLPDLPETNRVLATMCDMRVPLTFTLEDCATIVEIIRDVAAQILKPNE
jgi:dTDP-4-amino-4,6-dideoxygalactose transaminase